ncbi:MAG: hypothetical protein ACR2NU_02980 [Aeoliella sp.]
MNSIARSTSGSAVNDRSLLSRNRLATCSLAVAIALLPITTTAQTPAAIRQQAINQWSPPRSIDKSKLVRLGLRVLKGRHITLVTDLPVSPAIDELPSVVDTAVPLLAERFGIDPDSVRDWQVLVSVIDDREKFIAAGLMPAGHEEFLDGLSMGYEIWISEQPSDYYRRHLLLHELTHSFMATQLGGCGPGWYMEGMAELLGAHTWVPRTKQLQLAVMPANREAVPMWGRTKLIREAITTKRMLSITSVMKIDNREALEVEGYAWVWALAKFLDTHPRYRERFRTLQARTLDPDFDDQFRNLYSEDWSHLDTEWRLFTATLTYGHDIQREAINWRVGGVSPVLTQPTTTVRHKITATQGWQSTGYLLEAGQQYEIKASGRFVIGAEPDGAPWTCEPGGITLDYHAGRPLGQLLAAVDDRRSEATTVAGLLPGTSSFLHVEPIGTHATLTPKRSGVLYLRLNDSPASLSDNRGDATVSIRRLR